MYHQEIGDSPVLETQSLFVTLLKRCPGRCKNSFFSLDDSISAVIEILLGTFAEILTVTTHCAAIIY